MYLATVIGGCLACDDEGLEAKFFTPASIPWDELAFRSTREALGDTFSLRHSHFRRQIHVLNRVEQRDALFHGALERFASGDSPMPPPAY